MSGQQSEALVALGRARILHSGLLDTVKALPAKDWNAMATSTLTKAVVAYGQFQLEDPETCPVKIS